MALPTLSFDEFVGIPFVDRGRDLKGCDCWGLLTLVYAKIGVDLPSHRDDYQTVADRDEVARILGNGKSQWRLVHDERPTDAVLLKLAGRPFHVGVVVRPGLMLHALPGTGAAIEDYRSHNYSRRIMGFYRHECFDTRTA
jgi:cell wall-associated NlpC family hydrolase